MATTEKSVVAFFPDTLDDGDKFENWPTHLTLIPPTILAPEDVFRKLSCVSYSWEPVVVSVGEAQLFGPEDDRVEGCLIEPQSSIRDLHCSMLEALGGPSVVFNGVEGWLGDQYTPHITHKPWQRDLFKNEKLIIDRVAIVGKDAGVRVVRHTLRLGAD